MILLPESHRWDDHGKVEKCRICCEAVKLGGRYLLIVVRFDLIQIENVLEVKLECLTEGVVRACFIVDAVLGGDRHENSPELCIMARMDRGEKMMTHLVIEMDRSAVPERRLAFVVIA